MERQYQRSLQIAGSDKIWQALHHVIIIFIVFIIVKMFEYKVVDAAYDYSQFKLDAVFDAPNLIVNITKHINAPL